MNKLRSLVFAFVALLASGALLAHGEDVPLEQKKRLAAESAAEIVQMRSSLARTFIKTDTMVTEDTFKSVCGAVAKRVKEITVKDGFTVRHASEKNRNPANAATTEELVLIDRFLAEPGVKELQDETLVNGKRFFRHTLPIYVEEACLSCHGAKEKRPDFIVSKYPEDKAYGFKTGDLRGIISILVPLE